MIWAVRISMLLISLVAIGLSVAGGAAIRRRRWSHGIWFGLGSVGAGVAAWNAVWAVSYLFGMFMLSGPGDPSVESMGLLEPTLRDAVIWSLPAVIVSPFGIVLVVIGAVGWVAARYGQGRGLMGFPRSIREAVERLVGECDQARLDLILGGDESDLVREHFGLGMYIRNEFGLWGKNARLMAECGCEDPDEASGVILQALWVHLRETASEADLERAQVVCRSYEEARAAAKKEQDDKLAAQWETMTDRRCPRCGRPCPEFRKTCAFCGEHVGRA